MTAAPLRSPALPDVEPAPAERAERLARELDAAFQARARLYWDLYVTLRDALGPAEAERLLAAAIERRGRAAGEAIFAGLDSAEPLAVVTRFLALGSPDWGRLFPHDLARDADGRITLRVRRCPLKDAWVADGRSAEEIELLCRIAGRADHGVFSATACRFEAETWSPGREGCCTLRFGG